MVLGDFTSQSETLHDVEFSKLASVNDRFLAFVLDALIFTPIFSFILAQILKNIELLYYTSPMSTEFLVLLGVCGLMIAVLAILFQSVFLLLFGGTPGKLFLKLRVISVNNTKLTFSQCLARSAVWTFSFLFLCLPLLEVVSHRLRRALHDRASDTLVVTLKKQGDRGPHFFESQLIKQTLLAVSLLVIVWGIFFTGNIYKMVLAGDFKRTAQVKEKYLCDEINAQATDGTNRVDLAIALYNAESISADCLSAEADFALWSLSNEQKAWAYFAKIILLESEHDNDKKIAEYQGELCSLSASLCDLTSGHLSKINSKDEVASSYTLAIEKTKQHLYENDFLALGEDLDAFKGVEAFKDFVLNLSVKRLWLEAKSDRALGAFDAAKGYLSPVQAENLSAWLCHQELNQGCNQKAYTSCSALKQQLGSENPVQNLSSALALIRESECKKTHVDYVQVEDVLLKSKSAQRLLQAMDEESKMPEDMKKSVLLDFATIKDNKDNIISELGKHYIFEHNLSRKDINRLKNYLMAEPVQNLSWKKVFSQTLKSAMKGNDKEDLQALLSFVSGSPALIEELNAEQKEDLAIAFYQIEDFKSSWNLLKHESSASARAPASENLISLVRKDLAKKFEKK